MSAKSGEHAVRAAVESLEIRVMLSALNPDSFTSLGSFAPGAGTYTVNTTADTITGPSTSITGVTSGGVAVFDFSSVNIASGVTINASGSDPWAILSQGTLSLGGTIHNDGQSASDESASAKLGGPGGGAGGGAGTAGGGLGGGGAATNINSGAGGGGFGGAGARGATQGGGVGGTAGSAYGNLATTLQGGSGGAGGADVVTGGGGGGGIELGADTSITLAATAILTSNGGAGAVDYYGASGGGSGGGIFIHAPIVSLNGDLTANGGDGGAGGLDGDGGGGGGGRIHILSGSYTNSATVSVVGGNSGAHSTEGFGHGTASPDATGAGGVFDQSSTTASLGVTDSVVGATYAGQNVTYSVTVTNTGPDTAANVSISELVPTGTTFVSATENAGDPVFMLNTPAVGATGSTTGTIATLDNGASGHFSFVDAVPAATASGAMLTDDVSASADNSPTATGSASATVAPAPFIYAAPAGQGSDLTLTLDNTGMELEIINDANSQILAEQSYALTTQVQITGAANETNSLTIDYSNGFIAVPISYDGGGGTGSHSLSVVDPGNNVTTNDVYTPGAATGAGSLAITNSTVMNNVHADVPAGGNSSTIGFVDLSPILDTVPGTLTVNGTNGNDIITYTAGLQDPVNDGLVTVNNLESIEFSNKSQLTIDTLLGNDEVIDDVPTPAGMTSDVQVNGGDINASDTLVYGALPFNIVAVFPGSQGAGSIVVDINDDPENVDYTNISTLQTIGTPNENALDIEQFPQGSTQFTVTPSVTPGAGTITALQNINGEPTVQKPSTDVSSIGLGDSAFTETIDYSGFPPFTEVTARDSIANKVKSDIIGPGPDAPILFGNYFGLFESTVIYNDIPGSGNYVDIDGGEITDGLGDNSPSQDIIVYNDEDSEIIINLGAGNNDAEYDSTDYGIPTTIFGAGVGSSDEAYFYNYGDGDVTVDADYSEIYEGSDAPVYEYGLSSVVVVAENDPVTFNGTGAANTITYTPTSATGGTVYYDAADPTIYVQDVSPAVTLDPGANFSEPYLVTINGTPGNDTITAAAAAMGDPTVLVGSYLPAAVDPTDVQMLDIKGLTGDNNLTVDSTNGAFPIPITYNGGPGNNNSLTLTGPSADSDVYTPGPLPGAGSDVMSIGGDTQSVEFTNLAPFTDSVAGPLTVNGTSGNDTIDYVQGSSASDGEVDVDSFESIDFTNKTTLTIDAGSGNDVVTLDNPTTPTGLTSITVDGGKALDSLIVNAFDNTVDVSTPGVINVNGQPPIDYSNFEQVTILNALDSIMVTPVTINAVEGKPFSNVNVGTFTGGPIGAMAGDFTASIAWGDGHTSTGTVTGSNGNFSVTGSHTYAEYGMYMPVVTITDPKNVGSATVGGVPITVYYTGPLDATIDDTADVSDPSVIGTPVTSPIVTIPVDTSTGTIKVATFTDPGGAEGLSHYSATINWGDSQSTGGTITYSAGVFTVSGSHTYTGVGVYTLKITIHHDVSTPTTVTDTNRVDVITYGAITGKSATLTGNEGRVATGTVASFSVPNILAPASAFSATISWGDGTANSAGTIVSDGGGKFHVVGSHAFPEEQSYTMKVTINETGASSTVVTSTAKISPSPLDEVAASSTITVKAGTTLTNAVLGTFRDQDSLNTDAGDYTGTVNWGDGTTSAAGFKRTSSTYNVGSYWQVLGTHKYTTKKTYTVKVTFYDGGNVGVYPSSTLTLTIVVD